MKQSVSTVYKARCIYLFFTFSLTTHLQNNIFTKPIFNDNQHNTGGHLGKVNIKQHLFEKNDYSKNYKVLITKKRPKKTEKPNPDIDFLSVSKHYWRLRSSGIV